MRRKTLILTMMALGWALIVSGSAVAEIREGSFSVSPQLGGYLFEGNQDLEHGFTFGLGAGYNFTKNLGAEIFLNNINTETDPAGTDVDGYLYRLDGLYHFRSESRLVPYIAAGLGGITLDPDSGSNDNSLAVNYGAGVKYFLTEMMALRGDIRHVISFDDTYNNLIYTLGVDFLFGGKKEQAPVAAAVAATPLPEPDSDGDGVLDSKDKCPGTLKDLKVDANGCPILMKKTATVDLDIQFDSNKADIKPQYHGRLKEVGDFMTTYPATKAVIEGHTDSMGATDYNRNLSQSRADSVRDYLIRNFNISPNRLTAKGFGEERPVASNDTDEGRRKNRRIEAVITAETELYQKR